MFYGGWKCINYSLTRLALGICITHTKKRVFFARFEGNELISGVEARFTAIESSLSLSLHAGARDSLITHFRNLHIEARQWNIEHIERCSERQWLETFSNGEIRIFDALQQLVHRLLNLELCSLSGNVWLMSSMRGEGSVSRLETSRRLLAASTQNAWLSIIRRPLASSNHHPAQ